MWVSERVDIAHCPSDLALRNLQDARLDGCIDVTAAAYLHLCIATLLDEWRQPADLQLATDSHQDVGLLQLQDEARLGFDEMRILISAGDGFHRDAIAAHFTRNRRQILCGRDDVGLPLRLRD